MHRNVSKIIANVDVNLQVAPKLQNCHSCKFSYGIGTLQITKSVSSTPC